VIDNRRTAPLRGIPIASRPWEGLLPQKPWEWPLTAAIVHRDTPHMLAAVVDLLRAQTVRPYLLIVDTGSDTDAQRLLESLHAEDDAEVHYLRGKGWRGSSHVVAAAMDLAFAACQTDYLFATHTDCFPTRPDLISTLLAHCDERTPVVGWQMSRREGWPDAAWKETPSHTATMYHMPTMRSLPASWSMLGAQEAVALERLQTTGGYPDTESRLGQILERHGITRRNVTEPDDGGRHWLCMGGEPNEPYTTDWFAHVRTSGSAFLYFPNELIGAVRSAQVQVQIDDVPRRLAAWSESRDPES
jgi:CubicO group peptidase (beta-lactamase class C family)